MANLQDLIAKTSQSFLGEKADVMTPEQQTEVVEAILEVVMGRTIDKLLDDGRLDASMQKDIESFSEENDLDSTLDHLSKLVPGFTDTFTAELEQYRIELNSSEVI